MTHLEIGELFHKYLVLPFQPLGHQISDGATQMPNSDQRENVLEPFARSSLLPIQSKWRDPQQDKGTFERDLKRVQLVCG